MRVFSEGAVALVTGAGTGIGRATALEFARAGCDLVLGDVDRDRGEAVAGEVRDLGRRARFVEVNVADPDRVHHLHEAVVREFGRLDAACNNAGIEGEQAPTASCSLANFDRVIGVNLRGVFLCLREQLEILAGHGGGSIVNVASVAGLVGFAGLPAYCASKGGVIQLTRTAALEYATHGIRVNAVCPGAIKTEMIDRITRRDPGTEAEFRHLHPMERMGTVAEVAETIVWLCSPAASFITGQALAVDGGLVAR